LANKYFIVAVHGLKLEIRNLVEMKRAYELDVYKLAEGNRSHSLAADRLLQGFNRGQIAPKCVFPTDYALKPEKGCWLSGGKVNNYGRRVIRYGLARL